MAEQRDFPYIWATWLPKLLTGENSCEWANWFKAHHQNWEPPPSDFDQTKWLLDHTALLNERITNWTVEGHDVDTEAQNRFELHGRTAALAGRPHIIARRDDDAVIVDAKTRQASSSHVVQVVIYLYAIPRALERYRGVQLRGQVTYRDHTVRISAEAVDDQFTRNLGALIRRISSEEPARRVPNTQECRFSELGPPTARNAWMTATCPKIRRPRTSRPNAATQADEVHHDQTSNRSDLLPEGVPPQNIMRVRFNKASPTEGLIDPILRIAYWLECEFATDTFNTLAHQGQTAYLFLPKVRAGLRSSILRVCSREPTFADRLACCA